MYLNKILQMDTTRSFAASYVNYVSTRDSEHPRLQEKVHGAYGLTTRAKLFANSAKMAAVTQHEMARIIASFEIFI